MDVSIIDPLDPKEVPATSAETERIIAHLKTLPPEQQDAEYLRLLGASRERMRQELVRNTSKVA